MVSLGIWACRYRELQPISFGNTAVQKPVNGNAVEPEQYTRDGRGRGRNRDDGPSYEMVGLKGDDAV